MKRNTALLALVVTGLSLVPQPAAAQLFENLLANLRALSGARYAVNNPHNALTNLAGELVQGPKDIAVADLDGDAKPDFAASGKDGTVMLYFGVGDGSFSNVTYLRTWTDVPADLGGMSFTNYATNVFCDYQPTNFILVCYTNSPPPSLPNLPPPPTNVVCFTNFQYGCVGFVTNILTNVVVVEGPSGLRGLALADFTGDGRRDIAVASPGEGVIYLLANAGGRSFAPAIRLAAWLGVRDLAAGDFDGDGLTDLAAAGTTNGVAHFQSLGNGTFTLKTNLLQLASDPFNEDSDDYEFPQPAYYLRTVRQPGDSQDELIVSFAQRTKLWVLRANEQGQLAISGDLENVRLTALDAAPLLVPNTNGAPPDLITAYSRGGCLDIFAATNLSQRFSGRASSRYFVPGAPRNVRIADLDQDGWNDVVVVAQRSDRVLAYKNDQGRLVLASEAFTGRSPREMDLGDFNSDGRPDLAVLNRFSHDVSVFITSTNTPDANTPVGFLALDNAYPVDGGVSGLGLRDFNGDGRSDVLQLHRDTSEFSVRLTAPNGSLGEAVFYAITNGFQPSGQIAVDVNGDGLADMISANLSGSISVRLGEPGGTFGPEQTFSLSDDANGGLITVVAGDFDRDGKIDLAAAYFDCRVSFFKGDGAGRFTFIRTHPFIYEPRSMVAGDFDQDGDVDLIGASFAGSFIVVENRGDLFTTSDLRGVTYNGSDTFDSMVQVVDQNNDGDPDLVLGSPGGYSLWLGGPGVTFVNQPIDNRGNDPNITGSTFVSADLDGNGSLDFASICASTSCLTIQTFTNGQMFTVLSVPVPFTRFLATGDLDGDGFADLVGTGDVLWVALSSRTASNSVPVELLAARRTSGVVINEVLPRNEDLPLGVDGNRTSDWVEIYNGGAEAVPMAGWELWLVRTNTLLVARTNRVEGTNQVVFEPELFGVTNRYRFPSDAALAPRSHRLLICTDRVRTPYHTGYNLPAEGALLCLVDAEGIEANRVAFPAMDEDRSYARYADGSRVFVVNDIPSPGAPNVDNGAVEPEVSLVGVDLETLQAPGRPLRFRATARDDLAVVNVSVLWRRLDIPDNRTKRLILFDDGMNEDGAMNDGVFAAALTNDLPVGAEIQFYLECTDLTDVTVRTPGSGRFVAAGTQAQTHALALVFDRPGLEISEIVADNRSGLQDESGGTPDWVEVRNCTEAPLSLAGVRLGTKFFGNGEHLAFGPASTLAAGEHLIVFADARPDQGIYHAPFALNQAGEQLILTGSTASGARYLIDAITFGPLGPDTGLARLGCGGPWVPGPPTPRLGNVAGIWRGLVISNEFLLAFPTRAGATYRVEQADAVNAAEWTPLPPMRSLGLELTVRQPLGAARFYRVREE